MIDFRYHALSLMAVFLALAIGIVLGVTLGDSVVSQAETNLRDNLQGNLEEARREERQARARLEAQDRVIEEALPQLASQRLRNRDVALVASGAVPSDVEQSVREAVEVAGGSVDSVSVLEMPPPSQRLADALGERLPATGADTRLEPLARRIGSSLVEGGPLARQLQDEFPEDFRGEYFGADAVVFYRAPVAEPEPAAQSEEQRRADDLGERFEAAVLEGMQAGEVPMVGVETWDADPSQVPFYRDHGLSSVDSVDSAGGRLALVYALGGYKGSFGFKPTADAPLPEL